MMPSRGINLYPVDNAVICFLNTICTYLAPVVQKLDSFIHRVNHYQAVKYYGRQLHYPLERDLSGPGCSNIG